MKPQDELLQRYRDANEHDPARPDSTLREKVLAQARAAAQDQPAPGSAKRSAANDPAWRWRAFGGLAVLGLATMVVLQFDRGPPEEREIALGETTAPPRASPPADAASAARETAPATPPKATRPPVDKPRPSSARPLARNPANDNAEAPPPAPAPGPPPASEALSSPSGVAGATPSTQDAGTRTTAPTGTDARPRIRGLARDEAPAALSARLSAPAPLAKAPPAPSSDLLAAAARGTLADAREALAQGADVNGTDARGRTALMLAALRGDAPLVRLLLDAGADTQRIDHSGLRALDLAQQAGHTDLLPALR